MIAATRMGDGWLWYALGRCLWYTADPKFAVRCAGRSSQFFGGSRIQAAKAVEPAPAALQLEPHCWSLSAAADKFSFPLGNTMTAFSIALVVSISIPGLEGTLFSWRSASPVSRIV